MNAPWKWSEDGCQLIDAKGRTVLKIRPSDATQEEFNAICAAPLLLAACEMIDLTDKATLQCLGYEAEESIRAVIASVKETT